MGAIKHSAHKKRHSRRIFRSRLNSLGQPPGTLIHIGEQKVEKTAITVFGYDEKESLRLDVQDADACLGFRERFKVLWINVDGLHDIEVVRKLGEQFGIDSLTQEDILDTGQRPKLEEFERYLFLSLRMLDFNPETSEIMQEQLSLVLGTNYVITFQEKPGDMFEPVRQRIKSAASKVRKHEADFLGYALLDAVVDRYFSILEEIENRIDALDSEMMADFGQETFNALNALKRELIIFRKSVWPLREIIGSITREDFDVVGEAVDPYFRDIYDHIVQVIDTIEVFREIVNGMHETYLAGVNNRMNEIMKFLTMIATVFMPLSFIAGVYGMNFRNMPELSLWWGYYAVLALMAVIVIGFMIYYRSRKWY